jgi:hypothetical protein
VQNEKKRDGKGNENVVKMGARNGRNLIFALPLLCSFFKKGGGKILEEKINFVKIFFTSLLPFLFIILILSHSQFVLMVKSTEKHEKR